MIDLSLLNAAIKSRFNNANFGSVAEKTTESTDAANLALLTQIAELTSKVDGMQSRADALTARTSVVEVTGDVPNLAADLVGDVSSAASDLAKIAGAAVSNGELNVTVVQGTGEAIASALSEITGKSLSTVAKSIPNVVPEASRSALNNIENIVAQGPAVATGLSNQISITSNALKDALSGTDALGSMLTEIILNSSSGFDEIFDALITPGAELPKPRNEIFDDLAAGKVDETVAILAPISSFEPDKIRSELQRIQITPNDIRRDDVQAETVGTKSTSEYVVGSNESNWKDENTPVTPNANTTPSANEPTPQPENGYVFTYVGSKEELVAEFRSTTREITEFVAHWMATYTNQDVGAEECHRWHQEKGWSGCGYHYIIRRDGRLQRGRPIGKRGAHAYANGHNTYSIGVSFAGGYNCPIGTPNPQRYQSADSLNEAQMRTFEMFVGAFYEAFPGGQAWGHNDTDPNNKLDPGFDVPQYAKNKFAKTNISSAGTTAPLTMAQLSTGNSTA